MKNFPEQKIETKKINNATSREQKSQEVFRVQNTVSGGVQEYVSMVESSETQQQNPGTSSSGVFPVAASPIKTMLVQQRIAKVQTLSKKELVKGIAKNLKKDIRRLKKEARRIRHSAADFSAHEINKILAQIRQIKRQLSTLIDLAIEKLRELYIAIVLRLRLVTAS